MTECKFMRQDNDRFDGEKYCTIYLAKCDSKELEFCCDDNCTVRDMYEENERLKAVLQEIKEIIEKGNWDFAGVTENQILDQIAEVM